MKKKANTIKQALYSLLLCMSISFTNACTPQIEGIFGWSSRDNRDLSNVERKTQIETKFNLNLTQPKFYEYETIWWIYRITSGIFFDNNGFYVALYEDNHTPQPVLIDLRKATLQRDGCCEHIRYYYEELKPGNYLLRIAYNAKTIAETTFMVLPQEHLDETADRNTQDSDEIQYYSRNIF